MVNTCDPKIFFYLVLILLVSLTPLFLFRRRWTEVITIAGIIVYFFILNRDFIRGNSGVFFDARFSYEYILSIFKQWLDTGVPIGWNPYMNAGEPLYLFSNLFLWPPWVFFCWINKFINLNSHTLFNLFWTFLFVNFCVGALLLFLALYDDFKAAFFSFITLIISGMFIINLAQPLGLTTMYYFPYLFFGIILFLKRKNIYGLFFAIILLGISFNHYLPHYIILCVSILVFFILAFDFKSLPLWLRLLKSQYVIIFLAFIVFLLAASPALFSYMEIQNYISPTRGAILPGGAIRVTQTGSQPNANAGLWGYVILLGQVTNFNLYIHHGFYFGIIPLLLVPVALFKQSNKYVWAILMSTVVILFLGTGDYFWGYRWLIKYVPGFNLVRHTYGLAQFVSFLLICLSGYGFKELFRETQGIIVKLTFLIFGSFIIKLLNSQKLNVVSFGSSAVLMLILLICIKLIPAGKNITKKVCYSLIVFFLFMDLTLFYKYHFNFVLQEQPVNLSKITYPRYRTLYPFMKYPTPPDLSPLIFKKASLTHQNNNFIFFRHIRFNEMLKLFIPDKGYEQALGVNGPLIYFTSHLKILPQNFSRVQFIKDIYNDSSKYSFTQDRSIFFLEKDIDFSNIGDSRVSEECTIDYTKIDSPNELKMLVVAPQDGFLMRLENFHRGWQAFIDDKKTNIYKANYAFQAIRMPKGKHRVSFKFSTIYPVLLRIHIFCVFLIWFLFNFAFLRKIGQSKDFLNG